MDRPKILKNAAKCVRCGVEVESTHVHEFVAHSCAPDIYFAVDGGKDYIRRIGGPSGLQDFIDTSVYQE